MELILETLLLLTCPGSHQAVLRKECTDCLQTQVKPPLLGLLWAPLSAAQGQGLTSNPKSILWRAGPIAHSEADGDS